MIKYRHFPQRAATIGYMVRPNKKYPKKLRVRAAVAMANVEHDQFSRAMGRKIVDGRLSSKRPDRKHRYEFNVDGVMPTSGSEYAELEEKIVRRVEDYEGSVFMFHYHSFDEE